jgi:hypothetical protein
VFNKNELLKIELRLRNLIESTNIKDPDKRRKFVNSIVKVAKKMNSSHAKKKLA